MNKNYINLILYIGLLSLFIALVSGLFLIALYSNTLYPIIKNSAFNIQKMRPLHTTFAISWIFLSSISIISNCLCKTNIIFFLNFKKIKFSILMWSISGIFIFISIFNKNFTGKEYLEFNKIFIGPIFIGWLINIYLFIKSFKNILNKKTYLYMWCISFFLFIISYTELYFTDTEFLEIYQIKSMQLQWKAVGSLVASFNMLVYGILYYIDEIINKKNKYSNSILSLYFFFIATLNSFTNYTHHTYHLPQDMLPKIIGFIVSMLEIIILIKITIDVKKKIKTFINNNNIINNFLIWIQFWMILNLSIAILISIPPINSIIHGTHVVLAHSMGSMIGIDSLIIFLAIICIKNEKNIKNIKNKKISFLLAITNIFLFFFIIILTIIGFLKGYNRIFNINTYIYDEIIRYTILFSGLGFFIFINNLIYKIIKLEVYK